MADQDYPNLYADMEESAQRTRAAAIAFEHVLGGPEADLVPVNGYPDQPTIAGRIKTRVDPLVATLEAAAQAVGRFAGVSPTAPTTRQDGTPLQPGDEWQNSANSLRYNWSGTDWIVLNASVQQLTQTLSGPEGSREVGHGTGTVQDALAAAASQLALLGTTAGAGAIGKVGGGHVSDLFVPDEPAKASALIPYKKTTLYGRFKNTAHVSDFGIEGTPARADVAAINEGLKIATAVQEVAAVNETLLFDARNYLLDREITVGGDFRSFKLKGAGVGNANTWSTGGTTLITTWGFGAIRVNLDNYVNENFRVEGLTIASSDIDMTGYPAIHIVRGASNGRYVSGFVFKDVAVRGFGSGAAFQGMNLENAGNNYFGTVIMDNFHVINTGIGVVLNNASLNLLEMRSPLFHVCPYGGIRLFRDGLVGAGNGRGSSITASIIGKPQMEQVGGLFRTQDTRSFGGTGTAEILRSTIHIQGLRHEFCGSEVLPAVLGEPWCLGVDTDIIITGDVDYNLGYEEVAFPRVGLGNTIASDTPIRVQMDGGRSKTPRTVNAPVIRRTIPNTGSTVIAVTTPDLASRYALKSDLILHNGQLGLVETRHNGKANDVNTKQIASTSALPAPGTSGVNVVFGNGSDGSVINCTVTNNSGAVIDAELQVENLSSCTILTASEL